MRFLVLDPELLNLLLTLNCRVCHYLITFFLAVALVKQLDYYFSEANWARDKFLPQHMDAGGFVPIAVLATFPVTFTPLISYFFPRDCLPSETLSGASKRSWHCTRHSCFPHQHCSGRLPTHHLRVELRRGRYKTRVFICVRCKWKWQSERFPKRS
jgi:hypothetical protein